MIKIDWRMAPDWAEGHGLIAFQGITEVWINTEQYAVVGREGGPYPWGGGTSDTRHNHKRGTVEYITPRPDRWDGEGMPPIGSVCEFQGDCAACSSDPWHRDLQDGVQCTVIAHFKSKSLEIVAFTFESADGNTQVEQSLPGALRPARTPEQIAAEEREQEVNRMVAAVQMLDKGWARKVCYSLYDANYRKQEAP
ncbi:hypothetical protein [Pseudomonas huaxiensis]|uniref:hypothetical protein n=1 Tax=Pseudomonas huaxiensis TaxID=2213017 RepID=UPI000DA67A66|nr:hypothetical protein [Pseudomonas huaxiensis]